MPTGAFQEVTLKFYLEEQGGGGRNEAVALQSVEAAEDLTG